MNYKRKCIKNIIKQQSKKITVWKSSIKNTKQIVILTNKIIASKLSIKITAKKVKQE